MTLVLGKIIDNDIYIDSDSRLSPSDGTTSNPLEGALKTVILHPFVCVSFAGHVEYARDAISAVVTYFADATARETLGGAQPLVWLLDTLHHWSLESRKSGDEEHEVDFAIATMFGNRPRIFVLKGGPAVESQHFWLGSPRAFERFQELYRPGVLPPSRKRMYTAFSAVLGDDRFPTVGDFHVVTETTNWTNCKNAADEIVRTFAHGPRGVTAHLGVSERKVTFESAGEWVPISSGSAAGGSHSILFLVVSSPSHHGIAVHYHHGRFGILFCPQLSVIEGAVIPDVSGIEFVAEVERKWGLLLRGFIAIGDGVVQFVG